MSEPAMLRRFTSDSGRLAEILKEQFVVAHEARIAKELARVAHLEQHKVGALIVEAGRSDSDIFFVLSGLVAIEISGRRVATRKGGQHFGEMALIDPLAKRSATVRVLEDTVTARVNENDFSTLAKRYPELWRRLALELANRLRERGTHIRPKNERIEVFIGSTSERIDVARALRDACQVEPWAIHLWSDGLFGPGKTPIESLAAGIQRFDFGLVALTPDDVTTARGASTASPRDNIVFELGLLTGALGRDRTFMVMLRGEPVPKLPSDLMGVLPLEIEVGEPSTLLARVGAVVEKLRRIVHELGPR